MIARDFQSKDKEFLKLLLEAWSLPVENLELIPDIGYVVEDICIGFLVTTNAGICYLDNYITNPIYDKETRDTALVLLTTTLENKAETLGYKYILALANLPSMENRFTSLGYSNKDKYSLFVKELGR